MTPQEKLVLVEFLNQLVQVRGIAKDAEAGALIDAAVSRQPDAAYLLVQRALLDRQALDAAKAEIAALQDQLSTRTQGGSDSFLSSANDWGRSASRRLASGNYPANAAYTDTPAAQGMAGVRPSPFAGGSFLGSAAATAAGVLGGAFLFQGIEHLLGQHQQTDANRHNLVDAAPDAAASAQGSGGEQSGLHDLASSAGLDDVGMSGNLFDNGSLSDNLFDDSGADDGSSLI